MKHRDNAPGTLYLLCFERALGDVSRPRMSARHYLGWTNGVSVEERVQRHLAGGGARIVAAAAKAGIGVEVVWTSPGTRNDERRLKNAGHFGERLCPRCSVAS